MSKILLLALMLLVLLTGPTLLGCANTGITPKGWSGAVVAGDAVYLGSMEGELVSINALNRERRWEDVLFEATKSTGGFSCAQGSSAVAIYGSPVLAGDLVYSTAYNGKVYAINAESGKLRWIYPREGELEPIVGGGGGRRGEPVFWRLGRPGIRPGRGYRRPGMGVRDR